MELNVKIQLPPVVIHGIPVTEPDILSPFTPGRAVKAGFYRHKQGVIGKPPTVFLHKPQICGIFRDTAPLICPAQQRITVFIKFLIRNILFFISQIGGIAFFLCQHALLDQRLQADKIRISGKGGK